MLSHLVQAGEVVLAAANAIRSRGHNMVVCSCMIEEEREQHKIKQISYTCTYLPNMDCMQEIKLTAETYLM